MRSTGLALAVVGIALVCGIVAVRLADSDRSATLVAVLLLVGACLGLLWVLLLGGAAADVEPPAPCSSV